MRLVYSRNAAEEILPRHAFSCALEHLGVGGKGVVDDIVSAHAVGCDLHALNARQVTLDKLLKMLLKLGISVKTDVRSKTHHGGFAYADGLAELCGSHKGSLFIIIFNKIRYSFVSL